MLKEPKYELGFKVEFRTCSNASVDLISLRVKVVVCLFVFFLTNTSYWLSPFEGG